jgi:hypothetical protein
VQDPDKHSGPSATRRSTLTHTLQPEDEINFNPMKTIIVSAKKDFLERLATVAPMKALSEIGFDRGRAGTEPDIWPGAYSCP